MLDLTRTADEVFDPTGPGGVANKPVLDHARLWGTEIETSVANLWDTSTIGGVGYETRAGLYADLAHPAGRLAYVFGDSTSGYNGTYKKSGASGAGSWSRIGDLPAGGLTALDARVTAAESDIDTLQTEMDAAEAAIDAVEAEVDTLQTEMNVVEAGVANNLASILDIYGKFSPRLYYANDAAFIAATSDGAYGYIGASYTLKKNVSEVATTVGVDDFAILRLAIVENTADITALETAVDTAEADILKKATLSLAASGVIPAGDASVIWSTATTGLPEARAAYSATQLVADGVRVMRVTGAATVAPRAWWRLDPSRIYEVRAIYRRPQDVVDPAGASVRVSLQWLNAGGTAVSTTVMSTETLSVSMGRRVRTGTIGATASADVDNVWPDGASYLTVFIQTYQADSITDIESIAVVDVTDVLGYSPDLSVLSSRVTALESEDLADRMEAVEAATSSPSVVRYATREDARAATIPATADFVEVQAFDVGSPPCLTTFARHTEATTGGFRSADLAYWRLVSNPVRLEMLGAAGDYSTDDSAAYSAALLIGRRIELTEGLTYLVSDISNPLGVPMSGRGRLVQAATGGGYLQQNSQFDTVPLLFRAHLWKVKDRLPDSTNLKVAIVGDSTATDGYGVVIGDLVADTLRNIGIGVASVVNDAVGGTDWTTNIASILNGYAEQKHLLLIKFGINDAGGYEDFLEDRAATLRTNMRAALAAIRASTYGGYLDLSILLIGPNALGNNADNVNHRNNLWIERIHQIYVEAAKDYQCAYYSPYIESRNANNGNGRWLDSYLVHPNPNHTLDVWGHALKAALDPMGSIKRNRLVFRTYAELTTIAVSTSLGSYPRGVSYTRAWAADGWPFDGTVETIWHPDNTGLQTLFDYTSAGSPRITRRIWLTGSSAWSGWDGGHRERLTASRTYYVRSDGNNANTGLANTSGGAFATIQGALDAVAKIDTAGYAVTIQLGATGTYAGATLSQSFTGGGTVTILGSTGSASSYVISSSITVARARLSVSGMKFTTTSSYGLIADASGYITISGACEFGANAVHMYAQWDGHIYLNADITIAGSATVCFNAIGGKIIVTTSRTVTLTGTPAFSAAFAFADRQGYMLLYPVTYSGSATGKRYQSWQSGLITTYSGTLPGDVAGTTATGGQYV
jgi:hypothetical protein